MLVKEIYEAEERIGEVKSKIEEVDKRIIDFAKGLGDLEAGLYDTAIDIPIAKTIDGTNPKGDIELSHGCLDRMQLLLF